MSQSKQKSTKRANKKSLKVEKKTGKNFAKLTQRKTKSDAPPQEPTKRANKKSLMVEKTGKNFQALRKKKYDAPPKEPSENFSVEYFSKNIIKSESLNSYLDDGTNLVKNTSLPESSFSALSKYFSKILKKDVKFMILSRYKPLKHNYITIVEADDKIRFLQSVENNILTLSVNYLNNLFDVLEIALEREISKSEISAIETILHSNFSENYSSNIFNGNIPNIDIPKKIDQNYSLPLPVFEKLIKFYKGLLNILANNLRVNILFYIPVSNQSHSELKGFYFSNFKKEYNTIGIKIVVPYASTKDSINIITSKNLREVDANKSLLSKIYYENLCELNSDKNTIKTKFSKIITNKIRGSLHKPDYSLDNTLKIGDQIFFNPFDREGLLKIIEIQITPTLKKRFLLGKTGNLYEDDDDANDLVGNIIINNESTFDSTVFWSEGYIEQISSN